MQVPVDVSPEEYTRRFREVRWPVLEVCPICGVHARLQGHGSYLRNALPARETELVVMVHRLVCPVCRRTVSLLPSFLLPRFQHTARFVVESLLGKVKSYREPLRFHWRRFLGNANRVLAFLRDQGMREPLPDGEKERAMKLLGSIVRNPVDSTTCSVLSRPLNPVFCDQDGSPFNRNSWDRRVRNYSKKLGIKVRPYDLRHSFALYYLRHGGNAFGLQKTLGHTTMTMTRRYVALTMQDLKEQHALASPINTLIPKTHRMRKVKRSAINAEDGLSHDE